MGGATAFQKCSRDQDIDPQRVQAVKRQSHFRGSLCCYFGRRLRLCSDGSPLTKRQEVCSSDEVFIAGKLSQGSGAWHGPCLGWRVMFKTLQVMLSGVSVFSRGRPAQGPLVAACPLHRVGLRSPGEARTPRPSSLVLAQK